MAENKGRKCAHPACDCLAVNDSKYCGEYCEDAEKSGVLEIGCGCEHDACRG
jgi:hypothetical protein